MAKTAMIIGPSGDGKSTSFIVNPDGTINPNNYLGMNPTSTVVFNCDGKDLPFNPASFGWVEGTNLFTTNFNSPFTGNILENQIEGISANAPDIKAVIIDTINGSMNDKEMLETHKMTYDKWYDLAKDFYRLLVKANSMRQDLIIYVLGHLYMYTDHNGHECRGLVTNGKKLEKIHLESKVPIVLHTNVEFGQNGENTYRFETQKNKSTAKTPYGMFDQFLVPNSMKLVDGKIREFYGIN